MRVKSKATVVNPISGGRKKNDDSKVKRMESKKTNDSDAPIFRRLNSKKTKTYVIE